MVWSSYVLSYAVLCVSLQKLQERQTIFKKRTYKKEDKEKWHKILVPEMISSEESDDDADGNGVAVNVVKKLPWRSDVVREFFYDLDEQYTSGKSSQAKRQTKQRITSIIPSTRPVPEGFPSWATKQ